MKRVLVVFMVICFVFSLAGCVNYNLMQTKKKYPCMDEYDNVLAEGDGFYLVDKYEETYNSATNKIGIISDEGEWVLELSDNNIFSMASVQESGKPVVNGTSTFLSYDYVGEGVFIGTNGVDLHIKGKQYAKDIGNIELAGGGGQTCYFYNAYNNKSWSFAANDISYYNNGYMLASNQSYVNGVSKSFGDADWLFSVDAEGNIRDLDLELTTSFSTYSDGLFFANGYFFDINGNIIIDLTEYDFEHEETFYFENGKCYIAFKNPAGSLYSVVIDKNGEFLSEPEPIRVEFDDDTMQAYDVLPWVTK